MPQFETENIDDQIIQRMGDLSGVISGTQYQAGSPNALPEGVNLSGVGDPRMPVGAAQYLGNDAVSALPGMTPGQPAGVGMDPAEVSRLQQIAYEASLARIDAEEEAFQAQIAYLHPDEQERLTLARELEQTREVNSWLNDKLEGHQQLSANQQLQVNKNQWAFVAASRHGLSLSNPAVRTAIYAARNPQEMMQAAQGLVQLSGRVAQPNGMLAPGGRPGPSSPQGPKPRSGDIAGLIASRGPITVNMG
jgi:hypothetical protein